MVSQCQTYQQSGWGQELPEELEEAVPQEALTANHHLNVLNKAVGTCEDMNRCVNTTSNKVTSVQRMDSFAKSFSGATPVQLQVKGMQPPHLRKQFPVLFFTGIQHSPPCVAQCGSQVFNAVEELPLPTNMPIWYTAEALYTNILTYAPPAHTTGLRCTETQQYTYQ